MGTLYMFTKRPKHVPTCNSTMDTKRALIEVNRRTRNTYRLEHARGHQDRTVRFEDLLLEV